MRRKLGHQKFFIIMTLKIKLWCRKLVGFWSHSKWTREHWTEYLFSCNNFGWHCRWIIIYFHELYRGKTPSSSVGDNGYYQGWMWRMPPALATFNYIFSPYNFSIISKNLFDNNKPYAISTCKSQCVNDRVGWNKNFAAIRWYFLWNIIKRPETKFEKICVMGSYPLFRLKFLHFSQFF